MLAFTGNGPGNGICVGSEMAGGVENVIATNNTMVAVESAIYFKSNLDRGAWVTDIVFDGLVSEKARISPSFL